MPSDNAPAAAPAAPAAPAPAPAAAAAPAALQGNIVGDASSGAPATAPAVASIDDAKAFLTAKGVTAEDLAKLDEASVRAKYDELKAAEAKPGKIDPKSIELALPEGLVVDEADMTSFRELLADANISPKDRGQKLLDLYAASIKKAVEEPTRLWNAMQADWQAQIKADRDLGGQNFAKTNASIAKVLDTLAGSKDTEAGKQVREAFNLTGAGNHPAIVRLMVKAASLISEGAPQAGNPPSPAAGSKTLAAMYPSANPSPQ